MDEVGGLEDGSDDLNLVISKKERMPAAAATQPPKRRVLGGISTTPVGGPSSSSASSTSPNPTRVLRPTSSTAQYRPPSSQGRPLSTSTLSPPSASSASSPRIRAKVDLANIVSSSSSPASHAPTSSGRSSPFKQQQQQQQARTPIRRTGSTASIPSSQHGAPPRIHLSGTNVAAPSSPISTRSNSIVSNNPGASSSSSYLTGPPSPNVTIRAKHRNQSIDLGSTSSSSLAASARLPISLQPSSKNAPPSPRSHRRISSSSIVTAPTPFPPSQSLTKDHHHQNSISPPSSSVSSSASSSRRAHVIIGPSSTAAGGGASNGTIKVHSPTLAEHPPPSISLATPYESPVMRYETLPSTNAYDFSSPKSGHISPTSSSTSHDPFFPRQRGSSSSLTTPSHIANLPSITHELQQQHDQHQQQQQQATEAKHDPEVEARVAAAVAAIDAKKERKMLDLEITNKSLLAINANLEKERLKMSKEMRELRRRTAIAAAAAAAGGGASALGSSSFGSGIGGFIALLRGGRKHSADGSEVGGSVDGVGALSADDTGGLAAELGAPLENDEEYWLHAAMAELTDDEDGQSDDEDGSVRMDDDEDRDPEGDDGDGFPLDGEDDDGDDIVTAGGSAFDDRRQRARQRALAERKVAQLVRDWQKLDAAHTRCRSLVEDMLLRGRLACKLSLGPDQEEIVEEVRREEEAAEEERRKLMEMEMKRGTRVLHPVEMEERRERENAVAAAAAAMTTAAVTTATEAAGPAVGGPVEGSAEQADLSTESQTDSTTSGDTSVGTTGSNASSSTSTSSSSSLPPPTLVLPDDGDGEEEHTDAEVDNSDARSDISSKTERAPEALDEGDLSSGSARVGDGASAADISVD
ncbi:hypothetical protein CF327_g6798 [Tilletia walkeri]|nr:hypothetical protein CF327_g6798 [Tilletia walkeri]